MAAETGVDFHVIEMGSFFDACRTPPRENAPDGRRAVLAAATIYTATLAFAIARQIPAVAIGLNREDSEAWIEQSPKFIEHMRDGLRMIGSDCQLLVPFHTWTKAEMFRKGADLGVNLDDTWSCQSPIGTRQDGTCSACRDRKAAFQLAGLTDGTVYANPVSDDLIANEDSSRK